MRPRAPVLLWAEDPDLAGPLAFTLNSVLPVQVRSCVTEIDFREELKRGWEYRLVIILAGDKAGLPTHRMASAALEFSGRAYFRPWAVMVLANTQELAASLPSTVSWVMGKEQAGLFEWIRDLIKRKSGPRKGSIPWNKRAVAPAVATGYSDGDPSAHA